MTKQNRDHVLTQFIEGELSLAETCTLLNVHRTTLWRLRRRWKQKGAAALEHGLRGRRSNRSKPEDFKQYVCDLFANEYKPMGHSAFAFYQSVARTLPDYACYTTVLRWLTEAGLTGEESLQSHAAMNLQNEMHS